LKPAVIQKPNLLQQVWGQLASEFTQRLSTGFILCLLYAMAPEPKELWLVPNTGVHALVLFKSDYRDELRRRLFEFVENLNSGIK
jgi:hypothetical protein